MKRLMHRSNYLLLFDHLVGAQQERFRYREADQARLVLGLSCLCSRVRGASRSKFKEFGFQLHPVSI
jgi:hypothetical protein